VTIPLDIPMPPAIARLERDRRGYPVSYITRRRAVPRLRASAGVNRSQIVAALVRRGVGADTGKPDMDPLSPKPDPCGGASTASSSISKGCSVRAGQTFRPQGWRGRHKSVLW
jgi:hypothetical protein